MRSTADNRRDVVKEHRVIITADDFGLVPEINDAVLRGYDNGVVTSAALRVNATASASAAASAALRPGLAVGLHLVLCDGQSTLPRRHIPGLVDSTGRFVTQPLEAAWNYRRRAGLVDELRSEIRAQIERFMSTNLTMTFISSHYQLHLHPVVASILVELSSEYPIVAMRKPCATLAMFERRPAIPAMQTALEVRLLKAVVRRGTFRVRRFIGPDRVERLAPQRPAVESDVVMRLGKMRRGVTELVCHPGSLLPRYDGTGEAAVVTSTVVRDALAAGQVKKISWAHLIGEVPASAGALARPATAPG
ncbi:MAG: putative glycoside hydrolase/deacetylase ChbG (UPF0249 family) [Hyphomicrobiaceae bacterium]